MVVSVSLVSSSGVANNKGDFIFAAEALNEEEDDGCCVIIIFVVAAGATVIKAFDVHDVAASNSNLSIKVA